MAKELVLTYVSPQLESQRDADYGRVEEFNRNCLPLLKELGIFKERDINAYTYLNDKNDEGIYSAYLAKCLADAQSEQERELVRVKFPELWRKFCETHFLPYSYPYVRHPEYVHYDESAEKFVFDYDAFKVTEDLTAESPAELATLAKLRALDKALADINFKGVNVRYLFHPDDEGKISFISKLNPGFFSQLVELNK